MKPSIIVHGGAGSILAEDSGDERKLGCLSAARRGFRILRDGGSALDAITEAAIELENNPLFNAGTGSSLNADGVVEMDASIMSGDRLMAGAVAGVHRIKNPVRLARRVMEDSVHVLLAGAGAEAFAKEVGEPFVDPATLLTPRALAQLARRAATSPGGTIGAVAIDSRGNIAAATSTGGTTGKRPGRIGDSPLIGCGTYADNSLGGASATGLGEAIIKIVMTKFACDRLGAGDSPIEAARAAIDQLSRVQGEGGIILVDRLGRLGVAFNTERMSRACITADGQEVTGFEP